VASEEELAAYVKFANRTPNNYEDIIKIERVTNQRAKADFYRGDDVEVAGSLALQQLALQAALLMGYNMSQKEDEPVQEPTKDEEGGQAEGDD